MNDGLTWVLNAQVNFFGLGEVLWREIIGNLFGLASAIGGMRRKVWVWPVGIIGNILLFTVFLGAVFHTPQDLNLYGQAGRQLFFIATSIYGWVLWAKNRRDNGYSAPAVEPHWMSGVQRLWLVAVAIFMWAAFTVILYLLDSWGPITDAWILTGSILATFAMAKGWNEFWLIWIAVDLVGVPQLLLSGYYPSAIMYGVYGLFCIWGFVVWQRAARAESLPAEVS